jgi:hypothetical protein
VAFIDLTTDEDQVNDANDRATTVVDIVAESRAGRRPSTRKRRAPSRPSSHPLLDPVWDCRGDRADFVRAPGDYAPFDAARPVNAPFDAAALNVTDAQGRTDGGVNAVGSIDADANNNDGAGDDDDEICLIRRRRRRSNATMRKRQRPSDEPRDKTVTRDADPDPPREPLVPLAPSPFRPAALALNIPPLPALSDWDDFRFSLPGLPDRAEARSDAHYQESSHGTIASDTLTAVVGPPSLLGLSSLADTTRFDLSALGAVLCDLSQQRQPQPSPSTPHDLSLTNLPPLEAVATIGSLGVLPTITYADSLTATTSESTKEATPLLPPPSLFLESSADDSLRDCALAPFTRDAPTRSDQPDVPPKPPAGIGDLVLVDVDGKHVVGALTGFNGAFYHIVPCNDTTRDDRLCLGVGGLTQEGRAWRNAPLAECAVCMDAEADAFLACRCTVPATCMGCAAHLDQCPYCGSAPRAAPRRIERDLIMVPASSTWITVPLRIVLDGVWEPTSRSIRAQVDWPGVLLRMAVRDAVEGDACADMRLSVRGRTITDLRPIGAQGVVQGALVCVIPRLRGD